MSSPIRITEEMKPSFRERFELVMDTARLDNGLLEFSLPCEEIQTNQKATIGFTPLASAKFTALINGFQTEVAWHGVCERGNEERNEYLVTDILVYPQTVSGGEVDMEPEKYGLWLYENREDDRMNHIHMQAHSHVWFSTSPSSTDVRSRQDMVNMLGEDDFYIFMIWNKRWECNCWIYDMRKNLMFTSEDIAILKVPLDCDEEPDVGDFLAEAREIAQPRSFVNKMNQAGRAKRQMYAAPYYDPLDGWDYLREDYQYGLE